MTRITILNEQELRGLLKLDTATIECIEEAFRLLETKPVVMPPYLVLKFQNTTVRLMLKPLMSRAFPPLLLR